MSSPELTKEYSEAYIGDRLVAVAIIFIVIEGIFVALRFLSRRFARTSWGLDDVLIVPSLIFCWGVCIHSLVMVYACGVGYHADVIIARDRAILISWLKSAVAVEVIYCTAVVFPKLSMLALYLRLFPNKKVYRYLAYALMAIISANGIAGDLTSLLSCQPLAKRWDETIQGKCINVTNYWRFISLANIITDLAMLVFPLPLVWQLKTSKSQKLSLTALFLTGSFGLVSSLVRFAIFFDVEAFVDGTWASVNLMTWTTIEPGIYLIAACLPNLRPLWLHFKQSPQSTNQSRPTQQSTGDSSNKGSKYIHLNDGSTPSSNTATSITVSRTWDVDEYHSGLASQESGK